MFETVSFLRVIKTGFVNFWRNLWLSAAATMVMTITLVIFAVLFLLFGLTSGSINTIRDTVDMSVYFKIGLDESQIMKIKADLEADPKVRQIVYTSQQEAFNQFKARHAADPLIQQSLNELSENPLPAAFNIKTYALEDYPAVSEKLSGPTYRDFVAKVNFEDNRTVIERLNRILRFIVTFGVALVLVFSVIAILVIFNTITLTIYNRREEVEIMRLVGATNWYIRGPFLAESFLYALGSTVLTSLLLAPVFGKLLPRLAAYVSPQISLLNLNLFNFWLVLGMLFLASVLLSFVSTLLAIRKYLKV